MSEQKNILGDVFISENAQKKVIIKAIYSCYGIVGISSSKGITFRLIIFPKKFEYNSIKIIKNKDEITIDVYVIAEYGTNISVIAKNLCNQIRFKLKKYCNLNVENINVHIKGFRKSG